MDIARFSAMFGECGMDWDCESPYEIKGTCNAKIFMDIGIFQPGEYNDGEEIHYTLILRYPPALRVRFETESSDPIRTLHIKKGINSEVDRIIEFLGSVYELPNH